MAGQKIAICMPVFNESSGISEFLAEICAEFQAYEISIFVVDDFSTDSTEAKLQELSLDLPVFFQRNSRNLGHGPSTVKALHFALSSSCTFILAVDGDGQFHAREMRHLMEQSIQNQSEIGLGIRVRTNEPVYRKITSWFTRFLVNLKTKSRSLDANTPLRFYTRETLQIILENLDYDNPIPNLYISAKISNLKFRTEILHVNFRDRLGDVSESISWGKSVRNLPSKRFLRFCYNSIKYWIKNPG
jgi:glycosyltransferase involved in cell wall biosynthesis